MTIPNLRARVRRLDAVSLGLMREVVELREGTDPLLYLERQAYILALRQAIRGLESARVALAGAVRRLEPQHPPHRLSGAAGAFRRRETPRELSGAIVGGPGAACERGTDPPLDTDDIPRAFDFPPSVNYSLN